MRKTILVVEDYDEIRDMIKMALQGTYEVALAQHGEEALRLIDGGLKPDIVLTDVNMPVLNGLGLAAKLREMRFPTDRIVFMSGDLESYNHDQLIEFTPFFVEKPHLEGLHETIERALLKAPEASAAIEKPRLETAT